MKIIGRALDALWGFFISLKLAVIVILSLAIALTTATFLESIYDTATAQYFVYKSFWFAGILGLLGVNILCVAISRWPWQPKHIPFLLAHVGILTLLAGSWITQQFGLDGNLRVTENETGTVVEIDENALVFTEGERIRKVPVRWQPFGVKFSPIATRDHGISHDLIIDQFLSHADAVYQFIATPAAGAMMPAVHLKIQGAAMPITQEFWLWAGDASFKTVSMGPARFAVGSEAIQAAAGQPTLSVVVEKQGGLGYVAVSSDGKKVQGRFGGATAKGQVIQPGWKGGVKITVLDWIPSAMPLVDYKPARIQYGPTAPSSAIHVISGKGGAGAETWLGLGDRAVLHTAQGEVQLGYLPKRVMLPFGVRLDRFSISRYEGTIDPSSYSSNVTVLDQAADGKGTPLSATISMNEPLTHKGVTLYQASYEDGQPRPVISIFSVNRDPGRSSKYIGSLLIVIGAIALFGVKYRKAKAAVKSASGAL